MKKLRYDLILMIIIMYNSFVSELKETITPKGR